MPAVFGDIEGLDARDEVPRGLDPQKTVFVLRSVFADASMHPSAGSYAVGVGGTEEIKEAARKHADFDVAAIVAFGNRDQVEAALTGQDPGWRFLMGAGQTKLVGAERNLGLVTETVQGLTAAPGAKVVYDGGAGDPSPPELKRGDVVTANRAAAAEASPLGWQGITQEQVLKAKWIVSSVDGEEVRLSPSDMNPYSRSIRADRANLTAFDAAYAANARAAVGDREGHRELMTLRANAEDSKRSSSAAVGDVVMLGTRGAKGAKDFLNQSGHPVGSVLEVQSRPWQVREVDGELSRIASYAGGREVEAWVRGGLGAKLDEDDLEALKGLARREPDRSDDRGMPRRGDRDLAASLASFERSKALAAAPPGARVEVVEVIVLKSDVSQAIGMLGYPQSSPKASDTANVLADLAPAISQSQWARGGDGRMRPTGEVKSGRDALQALKDGFGPGGYRKVTLDAGHAKAIAGLMGRDFKKLYERVRDESAERDHDFKARRAAAPAKAAGASR